MAEITTKKVDALGFDKWQIADIKRAYRSNSMSYTKMERLKAKIDALIAQFKEEEAKTEAWEGPVKVITNNVLGMELTSLEVLRYHEHPEEFYAKYPEHPLSIAAASSILPSERSVMNVSTSSSAFSSVRTEKSRSAMRSIR